MGYDAVSIVFTLTFDSSPIKGEGILLVGLSFFQPALWILAYASMTDSRIRPYGFPLPRGMTVRVAGNDGLGHHTSGLRIKSAMTYCPSYLSMLSNRMKGGSAA